MTDEKLLLVIYHVSIGIDSFKYEMYPIERRGERQDSICLRRMSDVTRNWLARKAGKKSAAKFK